MKKLILLVGVALLCGGAAKAQDPQTQIPGGSPTGIGAVKSAQAANLAAGTEIKGQLQGLLDVTTAKVNDPVILLTKNAIKFDNQLIAKKGSQLIGHVAEVNFPADGSARPSLGIVFDRLDTGAMQVPLSASITSVIDADVATTATTDGTAPAVSGSGTPVGPDKTSAGTAHGALNASGQMVGGTAPAAASSMAGLHITAMTSGSIHGGSTLTQDGENLRLEPGTIIIVKID